MEPNKLAEELKKKKDQQNQPPASAKELEEMRTKYASLEAQTKLLQEQLLLKRSDDEESKAQQAAERLQKEQAALEQEADLRKTLSQAFPQRSAKSDDDDGTEGLKLSEVTGVMADAVGKAIDAQSKLILSKVGEMMKRTTGELDNKISGTQQALIKLVAGLSVDQAKGQYKDFDEFAPDIRELLSKTQGLSPEDAYLLAKARKASKTPSQQETETERPSQSMLPSSSRDNVPENEEPEEGEQGDHQLSARKVFRDAVSKAIDKQLAARGKRK